MIFSEVWRYVWVVMFHAGLFRLMDGKKITEQLH